MSNIDNALVKYGSALQAVKDHQAENARVFDAHQKLVFAVIDAENDLRDAVAEEKTGAEGAGFTVSYTPQTQTWADIEVIDKLVAEGKMTKEMRDQIVKTQDRPPRITISPKS